MTLVVGIVVVYVLIVVASCRVFRAIHLRDEQIEEMQRRDRRARRVVLRKTGARI